MNPAFARQNIQNEPTSKRLRFGYEAKSTERPSVQTARAEFLKLILDFRPAAILDLFTSCYPPFVKLLEGSETPIATISEAVEASIPEEAYVLRQPKFIREAALKKLIPHAIDLKKSEGGINLRHALENWASEYHLLEEWLLDDALVFLRTFEVADDKPMALSLLPDWHFLFNLLWRTWQNAAHERNFCALRGLFQSNVVVEERDAFTFKFKYEALEFEVSGPFSKSLSDFRQEIDRKFNALRGPTVRGARKHLNYRLRKYLARLSDVAKDLNLAPPPGWRKTEVYLAWLIEYQIPDCKTYRQIAREVNRDEKTVRKGIQRAASHIGLALRSAKADRHLGRPKGAKDKGPRRRVESIKRKLRGNGS